MLVQLILPVDLTQLLLKIDALTCFTGEFSYVTEACARAQDLNISLCAILLAETCYIGHEPLIPALARQRLSWVTQNYVSANTLTAANVRLVDYQSTIPLAGYWSGGYVASFHGQCFTMPVKNAERGDKQEVLLFRSGKHLIGQ